MRYLLALALLFAPSAVAAQNGLYHPIPIAAITGRPGDTLDFVRPTTDMTGREAFPMLYIDEATFAAALPDTVPYPALPWNQAKSCFEQLVGETLDLAPPALHVVPAARTIRVEDLTLDSLNYAEDTTYMGAHFQNPTIAYTLVHSGVVLVVDRYQKNVPLLRHEAIHWIIWNARKAYGHPPEYFGPCDQYYDETH